MTERTIRRTYVVSIDLTGDAAEFDRHLKGYLAEPNCPFLQDFGPHGWGDYDGPCVTGVTISVDGLEI